MSDEKDWVERGHWKETFAAAEQRSIEEAEGIAAPEPEKLELDNLAEGPTPPPGAVQVKAEVRAEQAALAEQAQPEPIAEPIAEPDPLGPEPMEKAQEDYFQAQRDAMEQYSEDNRKKLEQQADLYLQDSDNMEYNGHEYVEKNLGNDEQSY